MNKKGQTIMVIIMISVIVFIMATVFIEPLNDETVKTMNASYLDCSNSTITKVEKATCTVVDMGLFYFIGTCIAVGLALVSGKRNITGIITAIMVFIVVIVLITPLKDIIILARDSSHLNCTSTAINAGAGLTCIFVDLWLFYFVATCIAAGITLIFIKKVQK